ncbi:MAG: hypothetical protein HY914_02705 [Desulfomonile tiedjei]|nr:hypothetical protein [Desulfomonile tiedjei]
MLPEVDDSVTYVLKTVQMNECFFQNCPALEDLRQQLSFRTSDADAAHEALLAKRVFPVYHPLFSVILLGVQSLGFDALTSYKIVWSFGPLFFGIAFAYVLSTLWGAPVAGIALVLLSLKVFPDTGLHHVVPSNTAMGMALIVWARIVSRRGDAPWCLVIGGILLMAMHPVGRLYALMSVLLSVSLAGVDRRPRRWLPVVATVAAIAIAFVLPAVVERPTLFNPEIAPRDVNMLVWVLEGAAQHLAALLLQVVRLEGGLFGAMTFFCGLVVFGFIVVPNERRPAILNVVALCLLFLLGLMLYRAYHPGDVILRVWIPLVVILYGAVAQSLWYVIESAWRWLVSYARSPGAAEHFTLARAWPLVAFAVLCGYVFNMGANGVEQVVATTEHVRTREPLAFDSAQVKLLLAEAKPGDRVLYSSIIVMPYYFIEGAMRVGAVYYHPTLSRTPAAQWWERPDIRFAALYNPTVYHPDFEGVPEPDWWTTQPDFRFSPLSTRKTHQPLAYEGYIPASTFDWIEIEPRAGDFPRVLRLFVKSEGGPAEVEVVPIDQWGRFLRGDSRTATVPAGSSGWLDFDISAAREATRFRIVRARGSRKFGIGGITFGRDRLLWPWAQKAELAVAQKSGDGKAVTVRFDASRMLPFPLNSRHVTVLDDHGSSVLMKVE